MTSRHRLAVVAGLALALTAGCNAAGDPTLASPSNQGAPTKAVDSTTDDPGAASGPRLNAAQLAAVTYVRRWARPTQTRDAWYAGVHPVVTPAYAQLLADTDPAQVPAHGVTGRPHLVSANTAVVIADVPTDAGLIRVTVADTGGRWLIAGARPATSP